MKNKYQQILQLQEKASLINPMYKKYDLLKDIRKKSKAEIEILRTIYSMSLTVGALSENRKIYYVMKQYAPSHFNWFLEVDKPDEKLFSSGTARHKINDGYQRIFIKPNLNKYVFIDLGDDDFLISYKKEFYQIPNALSEFSCFTNNKQNISVMKNGTKNIIAAIIIAFGLIIASVIYAYSTRFVVSTNYPYARIDKWTGEMSYMEVK